MTLPYSARVYYFACEMLWLAMGLYEYLRDYPATPNMAPGSRQLVSLINEVAGWALDERVIPLSRHNLSREQEEALFSVASNFRDPIASDWASYLHELSRGTARNYKDLDESHWLLYLYCLFLNGVVAAFSQLVQGVEQSSEYFQRYLNAEKLFLQLRVTCAEQRSSMAEGFVNAEVFDRLRPLAEKFKEKWHTAVASAVHGEAGQQSQ